MKRKLIPSSILVFVLIMTTTISIFAQTAQQKKRTPKPLPDATQIIEMVDELATEISLTEKQKSQVVVAYNNHYKKIKVFKEISKKLESEQKREEMKKLKKELETNLQTILTKEQLKKYKTFNKEKRAKEGKSQDEKRE